MRRMCADMQLPGTATRCQSISFNVLHPTGVRTGAGQENETEAHDRGRVFGSQCTVPHFSLAAFNVKCKCGQCADFFLFNFMGFFFPGTSISSAAANFIPVFAHLPPSAPVRLKVLENVECLAKQYWCQRSNMTNTRVIGGGRGGGCLI